MPELQKIPDDISKAILKFANEKQSGDIVLHLQKGYITGLKFLPAEIIVLREKMKTFTGDKP